MNPKSFDIEDEERNLEIAANHFLYEIDAVEMVEEIGHGPKYIDHVTQYQPPLCHTLVALLISW